MTSKRRQTGADVAVADRTQTVRLRLRELTRLLDEHIRRCVSEFGLTLAQGNALRDLENPLTTRELSDKLLCEPSNATYVADKLEAAGLVRREPHPTDRRIRYLVLTADGMELRARLLERIRQDDPLAHLDHTELATLEKALNRALDTE